MTNSQTIQPETIDDIRRSMEGETVKYGEPKDLIWRMLNAVDRELDAFDQRIAETERTLGL